MLILVPATTDASISAPVSSAELAEIEAERKAIIETAKANGTYLKAPNGKDTNLTPEQWVNVRTKRFKAWFGDWEHDPKNASKVVDENGEPKVVYHGTPNEFYTFGEDTSNKRAWTNEGTFYFTDNEKNAETYGKRSVGAFLNIRNPYVYDFEGRSWRNLKYEIAVTYGRDNSILASGFATNEEAEAWLENFKQENPDHYAVKDEDGRYLSVNENTITGQAGPTTDEQTQIAKAEGYDGNIQTNIVDSAGGEYVVGEDGVMREVVDPEALKPRTNYVALDPNQIKSATENVGTYSRENNDIRYSLSEVNDRFNAELSTLTEENARERILNVGTPSSILLACGIEDKPIRLYGAKLLSKVRKHGYNIDDLKNLPLAMSEPIAVFKGSMENSFAILTELRIGDNNVLAALSVGKGGHDVDFNIISSVYDKRGDSVARWVNDGKLLYVDKEKALDYFSVSAPLAEAQNNQELISTTKVIQNFENPKIEPRFSLIGELGAANLDKAEEATKRLDNLAVARDMETAGKDAKTIQLATGWERGADGKWRYEIDDAVINQNAIFSHRDDGVSITLLGELLTGGELLKAYPQLDDMVVVYQELPLGTLGGYSPANKLGMPANIVLSDMFLSRRENPEWRAEVERMEQEPIIKAWSDAMTAEPYDNNAYESAEQAFKASPLWEEYNNLLMGKGKYPRLIKCIDGREALLHEVQHAIQDIEGFAMGGNIKGEDYNRLAGEVEARNVEKRANMTTQERLASLAEETEDVAREDQIILRESVMQGQPKFSLQDIANDVREYDATNSTELYDWLNFIENGSIAKNKTQFHIANTGEILNEYGIKGKINVTRKAINAKRHTDNDDHKLGVSGWAFLVATINNPLAITQYNNEPNSYRIYTIAEINGKNICAGVDVNATNGVEITKITTAFGRDIAKIETSSKEEEIYRNENAAEQISGSDNSHLYARLLSTTKVIQNFESPNLEPKNSLITPQMDADYLSAVERGDMETAQRMVLEAAKLAMPNTKVVDEEGNPKVVYHQTNGSEYVNIETGERWDDLDWMARAEWEERDDWDEYWEEREFTVFSRANARTTHELDGFFFAPNYDEYHEYGDRTIAAFVNIENPASRKDYYIDGSKMNAGRDERIRLQSEGYDGVIREEDGEIWEYVAFEPNQIKSADPVTYDDNGNVIPLSERFNPEKEDIRYSLSEEDARFERKTAFLADLVRDYNIPLPTFIAQTSDEFLSMVKDYFKLTDDEVKKYEDRIKAMDGTYVPEDDIILMNGGVIRYKEQMSGCVRHEFAHYNSKYYLFDEIRMLANSFSEEVLKKVQEEYLKNYTFEELGKEGVINEIISYLSEEPTMQEIIAIFEGRLAIDEYIEKLQDLIEQREDIKQKEVYIATLPLVKKNIELQKQQYGEEKGRIIVIPRPNTIRQNVSTYARGSSSSYTDGNSKAQPRSAETDRRGESANAQEVDYRHSLEEIINTPSDEEYKQQMLELAQQMERDAESRGLDVAQQIADTTGWVHLDDGTWKYYGDVDITEDAQEVTRYIIAYTVSSISHVI